MPRRVREPASKEQTTEFKVILQMDVKTEV